jgi:hypothetical protein
MKMLGRLRQTIEANRESQQPGWKVFYWIKDYFYTAAISLGLRKQSNAFAKIILEKGRKVPRVFVETGTYHGRTTYQALRDFKVIHTIELSEEWYAKAKEQFKKYRHVTCHQGDSAKVLETIIGDIQEPILFYLDAHYSGGTTALGDDQNPLLRELRVISKRPYDDIIFIDDLEQLGKSGTMGTAGHPYYPPAEFDWSGITREAMEKALGRKILESEERDNKLIIWRMSR